MAETKVAYGTSTAITITLATLASSATGGRESTAIDNTSNLFDDALVYVNFVFPNSAPANDKAVYVYAYGSEDGTNYPEAITGSDANYTRRDPTVLRLIGVVPVPTQNLTYKSNPMSVAAAFGGILPRKWGIVVQNYAGQTLTSGSASYTGITWTTA